MKMVSQERLNKLQAQVLRALIAFVRHTYLLTGRWPCPECGRKDKDAPLRGLTVIDEDRRIQHVGCWRCNIETVLEDANKAWKDIATAVMEGEENGKSRR